MAEQDHDRDSIDRAFAELVAGYHLTAERPDAPRPLELMPDLASTDLGSTDLGSTDLGSTDLGSTDLASSGEPRGEAPEAPEVVVPPTRSELPLPTAWRAGPVPQPVPAAAERYVPDPLPPLSRPGAPALVGWAGVLFAAVVVLAAGFGLDLPAWLGWVAVTCFIAGAVVLLTQLPRHRPPDAGDGAVL